MPNETDGEP